MGLKVPLAVSCLVHLSSGRKRLKNPPPSAILFLARSTVVVAIVPGPSKALVVSFTFAAINDRKLIVYLLEKNELQIKFKYNLTSKICKCYNIVYILLYIIYSMYKFMYLYI